MNINGQQSYVRLHDNPAAKAFVDALPVQFGMDELNGNEKFADLPHALPASPEPPGSIQAGDLMLYGKQTLVLFNRSFESSYRYTPIGKVINPESLSAVMDKKRKYGLSLITIKAAIFSSWAHAGRGHGSCIFENNFIR
ncbi:cyclophilin-like fold protein [Erwinia piriflorinigrans]|uniref:cyclophilin-like fold protein n=1 Tax=Erwinia piriflorinigrans TaxID=665097 RepID=UPI000907DDB0|nr:cyclophilin-like fold protein [Erwinia piriflorinigrans]